MISGLNDCAINRFGERDSQACVANVGFGCGFTASGHQQHVNDADTDVEKKKRTDQRNAAQGNGNQSPLEIGQAAIDGTFVLEIGFEGKNRPFSDEGRFVGLQHQLEQSAASTSLAQGFASIVRIDGKPAGYSFGELLVFQRMTVGSSDFVSVDIWTGFVQRPFLYLF